MIQQFTFSRSSREEPVAHVPGDMCGKVPYSVIGNNKKLEIT